MKTVTRRILIVSLCVMLNSLSSAGQKRNDTEEKRKLLMLVENAWNQASLTRDSQALAGLVADTFVYTDSDGTVTNKAEFLAGAQDPSYRPASATNTDVKVYLYENSAVVVGAYHTKGTYKGRPFDHRGRFTDAWIFQNQRWQCVATHTSLIQK